ncbi:MAG: hypothetical protein R3F33_00745 [Planctomycetota bacterium]
MTPMIYSEEQNDWQDTDTLQGNGLADSREDASVWGGSLKLKAYPVAWHNVIFRYDTTGESRPLLEGRAFLSKVWLVEAGAKRQAVGKGLLFATATLDTNGDGLLDNQDACAAIWTDWVGRNPTPVTPPEGQLHSVHLFGDERRLILLVRTDGDGNGRFTKGDPLVPYMLDIDAEHKGIVPWIDPDLRGQLMMPNQ